MHVHSRLLGLSPTANAYVPRFPYRMLYALFVNARARHAEKRSIGTDRRNVQLECQMSFCLIATSLFVYSLWPRYTEKACARTTVNTDITRTLCVHASMRVAYVGCRVIPVGERESVAKTHPLRIPQNGDAGIKDRPVLLLPCARFHSRGDTTASTTRQAYV